VLQRQIKCCSKTLGGDKRALIGEPPAKGDLQFRPELVDHYILTKRSFQHDEGSGFANYQVLQDVLVSGQGLQMRIRAERSGGFLFGFRFDRLFEI